MPNFGLGSSLRAKTFLERKRGEKGGEVRAKREIVFGGNLSHFLLLRDQATYKRRFE